MGVPAGALKGVWIKPIEVSKISIGLVKALGMIDEFAVDIGLGGRVDVA